MTPAEKQAELVARYGIIEDPQERLSALTGRGRKLPPLAPEERTEERRVQGCTSRLWLVPELREGLCFFRLDADSVLVKGLVAAVCEIYQGTTPTEVAEFEPHLLEALHLASQLSPTRLHGLHQVRLAMKQFALQAGTPE